jgi:hypothetical protein
LSSILRALKKLDEEAMSRESQPGEPKIKMSRMVNRRTKASRVINRSLSISLALLLLVIAGWMIINSNVKPPPPVPEKQGEKPPQQAPAVKMESPKESIPPAITTEPSKPAAEPELSERGGPAQETSDQKVLVKETKHPELILNGILWSDIPGRRVALINNRYLKEGDKIKGASVIQIREKTVTLQAGEEKWTIRLKK